MTTPLDRDEVRTLARLARIRVPDDELDAVAADLGRVLELVESMRAADTAGVEPMAHPAATELRLREDVATATDGREALQRPAFEVHDGYYLVPRVVE